MFFSKISLLAVAGTVAAKGPHHKPPGSPTSIAWENQYTATGAADVHAAAATAKTSSPISFVPGKAFDRIAIVYFENTDYNKAAHDPNFEYFMKRGLVLENYYAVTHPSQPNYIAAIAGDYFGMQNDDFTQIPSNVSTIIDLLEERGISWGAYQEDLPYSGFEGFAWHNQQNGANDYVRKHNPPVIFNHIASSEQRLSQIKNLSMIDQHKSQFHKDLHDLRLPQWMFITPNMTSDAHDSDITVAGKWLKSFLGPLMEDWRFMQRTLVLITFDENENYAIQNNILSICVGDALPWNLIGKTDYNYYNHYTELATVQANWGLPSLGRWDVGANVLHWVGEWTGNKIRSWKGQSIDTHFWNQSYDGVYNTDGGSKRIPSPNLKLNKNFNHHPIAESVKKTWEHSDAPTYYKDTIENNDGLNPPEGYAVPA